jgi:asparagine synthetase B (glutamine-hydrolysing)
MSIPQGPIAHLNLDSEVLDELQDLLLESMALRLENLPGAPLMPLGILFSGGLDSALLTYYAHLALPPSTPIDLLNVAFQNPRIHKPTMDDPYSTCPDRMTGLSAYELLCKKCPTRTFHFVSINIPFAETTAHRQSIISLMAPHNTEMDLSITSALYFASRGIGEVAGQKYTTPTRVLLSGLGADELFAGYARHTVAFDKYGFTSLLNKLELDAGRLGKRNLGRDDRVTSHWAREVRYPFLDEKFVAWAMKTPVWLKCGFGDRVGAIDGLALDREKLPLRLLAWRAGLHSIAREKKRAVSEVFIAKTPVDRQCRFSLELARQRCIQGGRREQTSWIENRNE